MKMMQTISAELARAREYEREAGALVPEEERPLYHFSPRSGWLNDPNGLSWYDGCWHLFYQYHPYSTEWGPMHWGHAVSGDLISWEYLPAALAPDTEYDRNGCFSGSALTLDDGSHLLMYTGCGDSAGDPTGRGRWLQSQALAIRRPGSAEYVKYGKNPVITAADLPVGGDPYEFRDPFLWRAADGTFRALVANAGAGGTQLTQYRSEDALTWRRDRVLFEDARRIGVMWECPNFFPLGGRHVLVASPMDMEAEAEDAVGSIRFPQGNNVCYITGDCDGDSGDFIPDADETGRYIYKPVDRGLDFYAPQVMQAPDGRTILIGWMQNPKDTAAADKTGRHIFGQMTVPRELRLEGDQLVQWPVRELEPYRRDPVGQRIDFTDPADAPDGSAADDRWQQLPGIRGRSADILIDIDAADGCERLAIRFAAGDGCYTELIFSPQARTLTLDRTHAGRSIPAGRSCRLRGSGGRISLRVLIDRWSAEIFVNGGEQVMSATFYTDPAAEEICFSSRGPATVNITKYTLVKEH